MYNVVRLTAEEDIAAMFISKLRWAFGYGVAFAATILVVACAPRDSTVDTSGVLPYSLVTFIPIAVAAVDTDIGKAVDERLHARTVLKSLDGKEGTRFVWKNPGTGNRGVVTPGKQYASTNGVNRVCRPFSDLSLYKGGGYYINYGLACRDGDGPWIF